MWFRLQHVSLAFLEQAPYHFYNEVWVEANADDIFAILMDTRWSEWFEDFLAVHWLTPPPHGEASAREVVLKTLSARERFLALVQGQRFCFGIDELTLPLVTAMVEDIQLETLGPSQTKIKWKVYYRPNPLMRMIHPLARRIFGKMFIKAIQQLKQHAEKLHKKRGNI